MLIRNPCIITARLLPGARVGNSTLSIEYGGISADGRQEYTVHIDTPDWEYTFDDLRSGVGGGSLQSGLESALSFFGAAAEAYNRPQSDNANIFPAHVMEWAYLNSDEINMLEYELEETPDVIEEN